MSPAFSIFILLIAWPLGLPSLSHEIPESHETCLSALDYQACILANSNSESKQTSPWTKYGPLHLNYSTAITKGSITIVPAYNDSYQPLFIAISCNKNKINVRGADEEWKGWDSPEFDFEDKLITDACR